MRLNQELTLQLRRKISRGELVLQRDRGDGQMIRGYVWKFHSDEPLYSLLIGWVVPGGGYSTEEKFSASQIAAMLQGPSPFTLPSNPAMSAGEHQSGRWQGPKPSPVFFHEIAKWPEFIAFAQRLGIPLEKMYTALKIEMEAGEPVKVTATLLADDVQRADREQETEFLINIEKKISPAPVEEESMWPLEIREAAKRLTAQENEASKSLTEQESGALESMLDLDVEEVKEAIIGMANNTRPFLHSVEPAQKVICPYCGEEPEAFTNALGVSYKCKRGHEWKS